MKKCNTCGEEFEDEFSFCPVDGKPFRIAPGTSRHEFNLTIISELGLLERLAIEFQFLLGQVKKSWPSFKKHPVAFTGAKLRELRKLLQRTLERPYVLSGSLTALLLVSAVILSALLLEKHQPRTPESIDESVDLSRTVEIDLRTEEKPSTDSGIGAGEKGRVGFDRGRGEGSRPVPARAKGGGGGGMHDQSAPSQGRLPQPSIIPAPISTTLARLPPQALPAAGIDRSCALAKSVVFFLR
jgi:hypothetical protein